MSGIEIRKFLNIIEANQPKSDITYTDDKDSVTASITGKTSGNITKLAKQYMKVRELESQLKQEKDSMTENIKSIADDLFKAEDALKTKYIKTVSASMTITKDISPSKKEEFDVEGFFNEVYELLDKDIVSQLEDLKQKYINIKTIPGRKGSLRDVKMKESFVTENFMTNLKNWAKDFANKIMRRLPLFDKKFEKIKRRYGVS